MKIYRVENQNSFQGLWYTKDGHFAPIVDKLSDGLCRNLNMDYDPQFKIDGLNWFSACDNLPDMRHWFSFSDIYELSREGYKLYEFEVEKYRLVNNHAAFAREHVVGQRVLNFDQIEASWLDIDLYNSLNMMIDSNDPNQNIDIAKILRDGLKEKHGF